jgi:hypothetical protein
MSDRIQALQELARRGNLPADLQPLFDEAVKRGLISGDVGYVQPEPPPGVMIHGSDGVSRVSGSDAEMATPGAASTPEQDRAGLAAMEALRLRSEGRNLGGARHLLPLQEGLGQGWGSELTAAAVGPLVGLDGDVSQELFSQELAQARKDAPIMSGISEVAGAVGSGLALAGSGGTAMRFVNPSLAGGRGLAARSAAGLADGVALGSTYGSGSNEENRAEGAVQGGMLGGAVGVGTPAVMSTLGAFGNALGLRPVAQRVQDSVGRAVSRSRQSVDDIRAKIADALADGQDEYQIIDALGRSGQAEAGRLARSASDVGDQVVERLTSRNADAPIRLGGVIDDAATGQRGVTADMAQKGIISRRDSLANQEFSAARAQAGMVNPTAAIRIADDFLAPGPAGSIIQSPLPDDSVESVVRRFRSRMTDGENVLTDFNAAQRLKIDLDTAIDGARGNAQRVLIQMRNSLDDSLADASAPYASARDNFRTASQAAESIDDGRGMARGGRFEDNLASFGGMRPDQQGGARVGYGSQMVEKVRQASGAEGMGNAARPLIGTNARPQVEAILGEGVSRRAGRENEMFKTFASAARGSPTAERLAEDAVTGQGIAGTIADAGGLNIGGLARKGAAWGIDRLRGETDNVRQQIVDALMTNDVDTLALMLSSRQTTASNVDAIARALVATPMISATQQ